MNASLDKKNLTPTLPHRPLHINCTREMQLTSTAHRLTFLPYHFLLRAGPFLISQLLAPCIAQRFAHYKYVMLADVDYSWLWNAKILFHMMSLQAYMICLCVAAIHVML